MRNKSCSRYICLILTFLLVFMIQALPAGAADAGALRQMFDNLDTVNHGNWSKDANNDTAQLAWGESYVMDAYVTMFEATGDTYYLDKFVTHGKGVLAQRDSARGVSDYRGQSLPAWRNGSYTLNSKYAIFAVHTGMIAYPMARFAALVKNDPALTKYQADSQLFLQAAKDAVAVHSNDWVDQGDGTGYYKFPADMPYKQAGMGIPFNQYLAMAKTELMIYRTTGEAKYLDHTKKMFQHFKNNLVVDQSANAYKWRYSPFYSSAYEDLGHADNDMEAVLQAYTAGIVFNTTDMTRFANTAAKKIIKADGSIADNVLGEGTTAYPWFIGLWSNYGQFAAPIITDTAYKKLSTMTYGGPTGLLAVAMLNLANAQPVNGGGGSTGGNDPPPVVDNPPPVVDNPPAAGEMVQNGSFSQGQTGWSGPDVVVATESNGNKYGSAKYGWNFYQYVAVQPGTKYTLHAASRKGSATSEARIAYFFYDAAGKQLSHGDVIYKHKGTGWEQMPTQTVTAPVGAAKVLIKLLANGGTGSHDFDDISLLPVVDSPPTVNELVINGNFSQGQTGWSGPDAVVKTETNGNKYGSAKYGWNFYQYIAVQPGAKYTLHAASRKGSATSEARIAYFFYDAAGKQLSQGDVIYKHKGTGWEQMPAQTVTAPVGAAKILIKLLANGGSGSHDFDNISLVKN